MSCGETYVLNFFFSNLFTNVRKEVRWQSCGEADSDNEWLGRKACYRSWLREMRSYSSIWQGEQPRDGQLLPQPRFQASTPFRPRVVPIARHSCLQLHYSVYGR
jgi:hypothetical protein